MAGELTITCPDNQSVSVLLVRGYATAENGDEIALHKAVIMKNGDKVKHDDLSPHIQAALDAGDPYTTAIFGGGDSSAMPEVSDDAAKNPQIEQAERARAARQTQQGKS